MVSWHLRFVTCRSMAANMSPIRDEIAVWWMPTADVQLAHLDNWLECLDDEERARAARFHVEIDRRDFIAAHALLRVMLSSYANCSPHEWRFTRNEAGKPKIDPGTKIDPRTRIDGRGELSFNLSHTHGLVAASVAVHGMVGIDVERIDPAKADLTVADEYFALAEVSMLRKLRSEEQIACFFRLWTLKEAYIKAVGAGFDMPLDGFTFVFGSQRDAVAFDPGTTGHAGDWQFATLPTTGEHVLSLAAGHQPGGPKQITPRAIVPQDLKLLDF
jgi:4'-phosphopantetheinyl transferase